MPIGLRSLSLIIVMIFCLGSVEAAPRTTFDTKSSATFSEVAESREWLALGHWRKDWQQGWRGFRSDVTGPAFFLDENGRTDPRAELRATILAFNKPIVGTPEKNHAQCRFLARREFLFRALRLEKAGMERHPCSEYAAWKKKLDAEAVSIVFASAYMGNAASLFGHTFLKFHGRGNGEDRDLLNYGVSYFAYTGNDGGIPFALFGLTGGYNGYFSMKPYHETLREYVNLEGRDIWEYRLNLEPAEVERVLDHLIELQQTHFDYYFLDRNCSYQILAAIEAAKPELRLTDAFLFHVIPGDSVRVLTKNTNLVSDIRYRPSLMTTFIRARQKLAGNERSVARRLANIYDGPGFAAAESDLNRLEKERRLLVLDSSLAYVDWKGGKEPTKYAERAHRLKTQRASLGLGAETTITPPVSARPENGHDSARVGPLVGSRSGRDFTGLQFRFAYHDLFSDDAGYRPDTHLEVLRTEVRGWWGDQRGQRDLRLHDLTFIEIISLAPSDEFVQPIGWRAKVGLMNLEDLPDTLTLAPSISGGIGAAVTPLPDPYERNLTLFTFAQGHADQSDELRNGYRAGLSWQAQALVRLAKGRARLNAGYEAKRYFLGDAAFVPSLWARAGVTITRNWEMRLSTSDTASVRETSAMLMAHFLL